MDNLCCSPPDKLFKLLCLLLKHAILHVAFNIFSYILPSEDSLLLSLLFIFDACSNNIFVLTFHDAIKFFDGCCIIVYILFFRFSLQALNILSFINIPLSFSLNSSASSFVLFKYFKYFSLSSNILKKYDIDFFLITIQLLLEKRLNLPILPCRFHNNRDNEFVVPMKQQQCV